MEALMAEQGANTQAGVLSGAFGRWTKRGAVVAMGLALAACQTIVPKGPPTTPGDQGVVTPGLPTDTARHRVALLVPMTGANADVGESIANATMMALLDSKSDKIRITTYDTGLGAAAAGR